MQPFYIRLFDRIENYDVYWSEHLHIVDQPVDASLLGNTFCGIEFDAKSRVDFPSAEEDVCGECLEAWKKQESLP